MLRGVEDINLYLFICFVVVLTSSFLTMATFTFDFVIANAFITFFDCGCLTMGCSISAIQALNFAC